MNLHEALPIDSAVAGCFTGLVALGVSSGQQSEGFLD
jgi:hypothetical protein